MEAAIDREARAAETAPPPPLKTVLGAIALGCLFDFLFYRRPLGISVPLFTWTAVLSAAGVAAGHGRPASGPQLAVGAGAMLFSAFAAWRAAPELMLANLAAAAYLFALFLAPWLRERSLREFDGADFLGTPRAVIGESVGRGKEELGKVVASAGSQRARLRPVVTGALAALPILLFFLALMLSADVVFKSLVERLLGVLSPLSLLAQAALAGGVAATALGAAAWLKRRCEDRGAPGAWALLARRPGRDAWGFVEAMVAAGLVNALFAAFSAVQVVFLLGGKRRIEALGTGITYSEYARQGFWELLVIGALAIAASIALDECAVADTPRRKAVKKAHIVAASLLTGVMMLSAAYRLWLYEEAYGFTVLRFYSHTFTGFVAVLFLLLCLKTLGERSRAAFVRDAMAASFALLAAWNAADPHALIASGNVAAARQRRRELDIAYLARLSNDAIDPILRASPLITPDRRDQHDSMLARRLEALEERFQTGGWPALHWAHVRAFERLYAEPRRGGPIALAPVAAGDPRSFAAADD